MGDNPLATRARAHGEGDHASCTAVVDSRVGGSVEREKRSWLEREKRRIGCGATRQSCAALSP
jgi:hypothetical protein